MVFKPLDATELLWNTVHIRIEDGALPAGVSTWVQLAESEWTIHGLEPGSWNLTLSASEEDAPERAFEFTSPVTLMNGETTRLAREAR